jgi:hypothetical protein
MKTAKEAADLLARFRDSYTSGDLTTSEFHDIVERLLALDDAALPPLVDMLQSSDGSDREVAIVLLQELGDTRAVRPLRRALLDPDYGDNDKLGIIRVLDSLGESIDEATFKRAISDPEGLMYRTVASMLEVVETPEQVEVFLDSMAEGLPEMHAQYIRDLLIPLADRRLLPVLAALVYCTYDAVIIAAVDAIERLKEPATIPLLKERAQYDPSPEVRQAAEKAALRLQVRVGDESPAPWITPSPDPIVRCMLSTMDGSGGQVLFVAREQPDGYWRIFDVMFNDREGIKDAFSIITDELELEEMMSTFDCSDFVDLRLERCRAEIARAYQVTLEARRRFPARFLVWQGLLEGEDHRRLEEFPLPALKPSEEAGLLEECSELMTLEEFSFWFFNPDEVAEFTPRYEELLRQGQARLGKAAYDALVGEAIDAIAGETYRRLLPDRLRRQAWLLAQLYEDEGVALWALAAAAAMEGGVLTEHPLLRQMIDLSFRNATGQGPS